MRVQVQPKLVSETRVEVIDLSPMLAVGQTTSAASVSTSVYSGIDASPPTLSAAVSSAALSVTLPTGGVAGVIYQVTVSVTCANPASTLPVTFYLAVVPDLP